MNLPADEAREPGAGRVDSEPAAPEQVAPAAVAGAKATTATDTDPAGADPRIRARRRLLDEVFGDVLPTVTRDELDDGSDRAGTDREQWYRDNRPPHHG